MLASMSPTSPLTEPEKHFPLSDFEREVIKLIAEGYKDDEIAARLGTNETNIEQCLVSIYAKIHVSNRLELIIKAFHTGIVRLPQ